MKYLLISYKKHLNDKKIKKNELTASKSRLFFVNKNTTDQKSFGIAKTSKAFQNNTVVFVVLT